MGCGSVPCLFLSLHLVVIKHYKESGPQQQPTLQHRVGSLPTFHGPFHHKPHGNHRVEALQKIIEKITSKALLDLVNIVIFKRD